ncbi:MAG: hypothetical protein QOJ98_2835 [Acidobacteriota bacterium]|nr:hypothetical protein [Acidobacteriota bacterium]
MRRAGLAAALLLLVAAVADAQSASNTLIVPVAGSVTGANSETFRTALRLRGHGPGRIYFRGSSHFGDERDPSVAYIMHVGDEGTATVYFDDVMGAIGVSGLGSLDIVPDRPEFTFVAETYVYHQTPGGRFGSDVPFVRSGQVRDSYHIPIDPETLTTSRINVGIRTFANRVTARLWTLRGDILWPLKEFDVPAKSFKQYSLAELLQGGETCSTLEECAGGDLILEFPFEGRRGALVYSTVTDNGTGDPRVYVPGD